MAAHCLKKNRHPRTWPRFRQHNWSSDHKKCRQASQWTDESRELLLVALCRVELAPPPLDHDLPSWYRQHLKSKDSLISGWWLSSRPKHRGIVANGNHRLVADNTWEFLSIRCRTSCCWLSFNKTMSTSTKPRQSSWHRQHSDQTMLWVNSCWLPSRPTVWTHDDNSSALTNSTFKRANIWENSSWLLSSGRIESQQSNGQHQKDEVGFEPTSSQKFLRRFNQKSCCWLSWPSRPIHDPTWCKGRATDSMITDRIQTDDSPSLAVQTELSYKTRMVSKWEIAVSCLGALLGSCSQ